MQNPTGNNHRPKAKTVVKILSPTPESIELVAAAIRQGDVVGMPTETVYGLAGDCRNPSAVARIFETKERPTFDPLIVHVDENAKSLDQLEQLGLIDRSQISKKVQKSIHDLIQVFWPGPLTLILPKNPKISDLVTSGLPSIALRMPSHPVAQALIRASQTALAAPSANRFGRISPTSATAVEEELGDRISYILDGGSCTIGVESTVLTWDSNGSPWILRQGGTPQEKIEKVLNTSIQSRTQAAHAPASPGMLESHYAPKKSLYLLPKKISELEKADWTAIQTLLKQKAPPASPLGLIVMGGDPTPLASQLNHSLGRCFDVHSLSHSNSVEEMAKNLFATMRLIDSSPVEVILSEPCTIELGLGHAIADRLKRASTRW